MSIKNVKKYTNYDEYLEDQSSKSKSPKLRKKLQNRFEPRVRQFIQRFKFLKKANLICEGQKALCLGARIGEEVEALNRLKLEAIGVDLVPCEPLVIEADFNNLPFEDETFDVIYSNSFDHAHDAKMFYDSVQRVLCPGGVLVLDIFMEDSMKGKMEVLLVDEESDIVELFCKDKDFELVETFKKLPKLYRNKHVNIQFVLQKNKQPKPVTKGQRKIFLDCGGNKGQSIRLFKQSKLYSSDFEMYSFEPVMKLANKYKDMPDVIFSEAAVWIYDGEIDFYLDLARRRAEGSTLLKEKKSRSLNRDNPIKIPCIDFSKWVENNFDKSDFIILKMDIEGAEYEVLNKMLDDGSIDYIDDLYIEWHSHKVGIPKKDHQSLVQRLKGVASLKILPEMKLALKEG